MISLWIELIRIKSSWHATLQCTSLSRIFNSCASEKRSAVTAFNKQTVQLQKKNKPFEVKMHPQKKRAVFWVPNFTNLLPQILQFLTKDAETTKCLKCPAGNTEAPFAN